MPHKITPSRRKFQIAREFVKELQKLYGKQLKAVFVVGSVAANLAVPKSDIDVIYIIDKKVSPKQFLKFQQKKKQAFDICCQKTKENIQTIELTENDLKETNYPALWNEQLRRGAIPIFGKKETIARLEETTFSKPSILLIKAQYAYKVKEKKAPIAERIQFKRSIAGRKRFLPR